MPTLQVRPLAENAGVGGSQWAAETMGIWQGKGGLTTQQDDDQVREGVWEIAPYKSFSNTQRAGPKQWDHLIEHRVAHICDVASTRPLWKQYLADKTNLRGQKLREALDEFADDSLDLRTNWSYKTPTKKSKFVHVGVYFIAPMPLSLMLVMCRYRRRCGTNLGSQVISYEGASPRLHQIPCRAI